MATSKWRSLHFKLGICKRCACGASILSPSGGALPRGRVFLPIRKGGSKSLGRTVSNDYLNLMSRPVLYSFRRCPYAMRARLAIAASGVEVELREILLRDKAQEFLETSPSGTVPSLQLDDRVIDESFDIMLWALEQSDPENWLHGTHISFDLIETCDGPFKTALDRYKYHTRYKADPNVERAIASEHLHEWNLKLGAGWLQGNKASLADYAILPFVRQFANVDRDWFEAQPWTNLHRWLAAFVESSRFAAIMQKYPVWKPGDAITLFGPRPVLENT